MKKISILAVIILSCTNVNLAQNYTQQVTALQYYFNTDPGIGISGNGAIIPLTPAASINQTLSLLLPSSLDEGVNHIYVRAKDEFGQWGIAERRSFFIVQNTSSELVTALEYYFDVDLGVGNGTVQVVGPSSTYSGNLAISLPITLSTGVHHLYIRAKDENGSWSIAERRSFFILQHTISELVSALEYYFDVDPGVGNGTVQVVGPSSTYSGNLAITLPSTMSNGVHHLYIRIKDENGSWGIAERRSFFIIEHTSSQSVSALEYYIDTDPGVGNGTVQSVGPSSTYSGNLAITLPITMSNGVHHLYIRAKDENGSWGLAERRSFFIVQHTSSELVSALEYYYDADPGVGNANPIAITAASSVDELYELGVPCLSTGTHYLYVRAIDEYGSWSIIERDTLTVTSGIAAAEVTPSGPINICSNSSVALSFTPVTGVSYQWLLNGDDISGETGSSYVVTAAGNYSLKSTCGSSFITSNVVSVTMLPLISYYADADNDGYGDPSVTQQACTQPLGYVTNNTDCNDADATVYESQEYYVDADQDSYGSTTTAMVCASTPPTGYSNNNTDCDDGNSSIHALVTYYVDADEDGYGSTATATFCSSTAPSGYSANNTDCDDNDNSKWQSATFYIDVDADGYSPGTAIVCYGASIPTGYATTTSGSDCDDNLAAIHEHVEYFVDADQDGYGSTTTEMVCSLTPPAGYSLNSNDCDDGDVNINPGATEICNNLIDDDCDGAIDDDDLSVTGQPAWYADADGDGFGDPGVSQNKCIQPAEYISDNTDCNDSDPLEHPGQVWYIDNDDDDYGTGATLTQCLRPAHGYLAGELIETTGDCDDNNPLINIASQYITFSGAPNFTNSLCNPLSGTSYSNFTFEVNYFDATNALPPPTFPRVILDYEGNGVFNNTNDRLIIMTPDDVNDLNTVDGKRYIGTINSLSAGTNWQTRVQSNNSGCFTQIGPFNYPDVLILPDLQIFANDISFTNANPPVSSPQAVHAVIHNVSDFAAENFYVHLVNQYDNSSPADILVGNLAPHSSTTVTWNITTPALPAWCPMQVSVDNTYEITESNELDNSAVRPFINGNYNLPGGIEVVNSTASPSVAYTSNGTFITASGRGLYYGTPFPLSDPSVAGATITFTIVETNASYTTYTNSQGYFSYSFPAPQAIGTYHIQGTITDYTFSANFSSSFEMINTPTCLPDLVTSVSLSDYLIIEGNSISGSVTVTNVGCAATTESTLLDISQTGGSPLISDVMVPPLDPGASYTTTFNAIFFSTAGQYSICGMADASYLETESNEGNNTTCKVLTVIPALPDIYPAGGPCCYAYICDGPESLTFSVGNAGGSATGAFNCDIIVRLDNTEINTLQQAISNIDPLSTVSFTIPITYSSPGSYTFELQCDVPMPNGVVAETNETNNIGVYGRTINDCKPDLVISGCDPLDVQPVDPQNPGMVTYVVTMSNSGNATAMGPIVVRFHQSDGTNYDTQYNGDIAPGQSTLVSSVNVPSVVPATQTLTAIADPFNAITEWDETNNSVTNSLCWDFQPVGLCGSDFWGSNYLVNQSVYLSVGLKQYNIYDAYSVKVRFQVSGPGLNGTITLGDAIVNNVEKTCYCPRVAALPYSFVFPQVGTFTFTMTADPDGDYTECDEGNNVLVVNVTVTSLPDMRILSQHINPSLLNPQIDQDITIDVTYENIGYSNITDNMELNVLVDGTPLNSVYPVAGLVTGDNATISIPTTWSSNVPGSHIIRAIIDNNHQVTEEYETNNEATRAVVVGEAANLYFQVFESSNPSPALNSSVNINAQIGNNGDLACEADVQFFYITNTLDEQFIGTIHVSVNDNSNTAIALPWIVLNNSTTLIGRIINSSILEFNYDDNQATTTIGNLALTLTSVQSCFAGNNGMLIANATGGDTPYSYLWSNTFNDQVLTAGPGTYDVTITDNSGQSVTASGNITQATEITVNAGDDVTTFFGITSMQQVDRTAVVSGGTAPFTFSWTLGRPLLCNQVNEEGDESFYGGTCTNNSCPESGTPAETASCSGSATVTAVLLETTSICVTVTDDNGCTASDCFIVNASDARCFAGNSENHKIEICHHTNSPNNPWVEICVDTNSIAAHLAHGDYIGPCDINEMTEFEEDLSLNEEDLSLYEEDLSLNEEDLSLYEEDLSLNLRLFPNPARELVTLEFNSLDETSYVFDIVDMTGRKLASFRGTTSSGKNTRDMSIANMVPGIYLVKLVLDSKQEVKKLMRQ